MNDVDRWREASPCEVRRQIRAGLINGPTAGMARGFAQANLVIVPAEAAGEFAEFCRLNPRSCPLIDQSPPGDYWPRRVAQDADLRRDLPRYRVFYRGLPAAEEPTDIQHLWRGDFVAFLLGCSFTFERALLEAGLPVRHLQQNRNVPMYRTTIASAPAGRFQGPLVVSMRPYLPEQIEQVRAVTRSYPRMHGEPVHAGQPAELGIADLSRPDFGEAVPLEPGEVPVFWACGVTPQLALTAAQLEIAITHSPGCMFIMDQRDESFYVPLAEDAP